MCVEAAIKGCAAEWAAEQPITSSASQTSTCQAARKHRMPCHISIDSAQALGRAHLPGEPGYTSKWCRCREEAGATRSTKCVSQHLLHADELIFPTCGHQRPRDE